MKSPFGQNRATKNLTLFPKNQKDEDELEKPK